MGKKFQQTASKCANRQKLTSLEKRSSKKKERNPAEKTTLLVRRAATETKFFEKTGKEQLRKNLIRRPNETSPTRRENKDRRSL